MYNLMASNTQTAASAPEFPWWIVLVEGIFALIFGIFLIAEPAITSVFLVTVLGFYWLIRGIFSIIQIFIGGSSIHWGWLLFMGILGIIAGLVVLRHPMYATILVGAVLVIVVGVEGLIMGIVGLFQAFSGAGWGAGILAALSIIISIILLANVWLVTYYLPYVIAIFLIIGGISAIFFSFRLRRA
ncbi:MAG: hypothetical protein AUH89_06450 [Ktedonobacter sp. 13_1_40CM_4_52_4]|nr:MAG: hypothetical protein AUH89_06450 [Ktedonobacter sp. 13_1_40CM_4_52_4]